MDDDDDDEHDTQLFERFGKLIDDGVDIDDLRRALQGSFMLSMSAEQRQGYDQLRLELDAYLRARRDGEAAVTTPEGFVPSPDLSKPNDD